MEHYIIRSTEYEKCPQVYICYELASIQTAYGTVTINFKNLCHIKSSGVYWKIRITTEGSTRSEKDKAIITLLCTAEEKSWKVTLDITIQI